MQRPGYRPGLANLSTLRRIRLRQRRQDPAAVGGQCRCPVAMGWQDLEEAAIGGSPAVKQSGGKEDEAKVVEVPQPKRLNLGKSQSEVPAGWPKSADIPDFMASNPYDVSANRTRFSSILTLLILWRRSPKRTLWCLRRLPILERSSRHG